MSALRDAIAALLALPRRFPGVSWTLAERALSLLLAFVGTVLVSRYLGAERFGTLAYAQSLVSLFLLLSHGGLTGLVIRNLAQRPEATNTLLGTAFALRTLGALLAFLALLAVAGGLEGLGSPTFLLVGVLGLAILLKPIDVLDYRLQAASRFQALALARLAAALVTFGLRGCLVLLGGGVLAFALPPLVASLVLALAFVGLSLGVFPRALGGWRWSLEEARGFLRQGGWLFLSSLAAVLTLKVDQLMLQWLAGAEAVGTYAVAASLSEGWYFLPAAIVTAFFPRLVTLRKTDSVAYEAGLARLLRGLWLLALAIAVFIQGLGGPLMEVLFGSAYAPSAAILKVHIWAGLFVFLREVFSRWLLLENLLVFSLVTHLLGAVVNIALNLWWIPFGAGLGAAYASLVSYAVAAYFSLALSRRTRPFFAMMTRAALGPLAGRRGASTGA